MQGTLINGAVEALVAGTEPELRTLADTAAALEAGAETVVPLTSDDGEDPSIEALRLRRDDQLAQIRVSTVAGELLIEAGGPASGKSAHNIRFLLTDSASNHLHAEWFDSEGSLYERGSLPLTIEWLE
ncbi:MAG TPA: hypothetical protein VGQ42_08410 [Candidatus Dormibacteraeota bacterium]|nr:hypothetical protein [Candidatus Dormibacteraeota bacterium]